MTQSRRTLTTLATLAGLLLAGCHVTESDRDGSKNVSIGTPFGSMKVATGKTVDAASVGISPYPGATPVQDQGDDGNNANVQMSFGGFHLGVRAADFQTADSPQKVLAFYRQDLSSRYGAPIECRDQHPIGSPDRTAQGLTCKNDEGSRVAGSKVQIGGVHPKGVVILSNDSPSETEIELRAGSPKRMHVVGVEPHNGGTQISLVSIDLPTGHDSSDSE